MMKNSNFVRGAGVLGCLFYLVFSGSAPASAGGVYFVKSGDTLTGISRLFGVAVDRIQEANQLQTADISPGDRIRIPDAPPKPDPVVDVSRPRGVSTDRVLQAVCRDETVYHSVVRGDTLSSIASRYDTELDNLLQLNGMRRSARLAIGQKVVVRKSGPRAHTVARGETLTRIASRYGIETGELALLNHLDGDTIAAGQRLVIEPCDPYASAGSVPPPLGGQGSEGLDVGGLKTTTPGSAAAMSQRVVTHARSMLNVP